jgi:uncharacterized protein YndB with AHSA1/START domain
MTIMESVDILAPADVVFDAYVNHIDSWWVRRGTYRYSFAPESTEPRHIRFEAELGGRFWESFADETEYEIGRIVGWDPPHLLRYTWRAPVWPIETTITVTFTETDEGTRVEVTHEGFGVDGVPDLGDGYAVGLREILGGLKAWVQDRAA